MRLRFFLEILAIKDTWALKGFLDKSKILPGIGTLEANILEISLELIL